MKQFKEGQIVKDIVEVPYITVGEIAEIQKKKDLNHI